MQAMPKHTNGSAQHTFASMKWAVPKQTTALGSLTSKPI